jgi:hypothetical protein
MGAFLVVIIIVACLVAAYVLFRLITHLFAKVDVDASGCGSAAAAPFKACAAAVGGMFGDSRRGRHKMIGDGDVSDDSDIEMGEESSASESSSSSSDSDSDPDR